MYNMQMGDILCNEILAQGKAAKNIEISMINDITKNNS